MVDILQELESIKIQDHQHPQFEETNREFMTKMEIMKNNIRSCNKIVRFPDLTTLSSAVTKIPNAIFYPRYSDYEDTMDKDYCLTEKLWMAEPTEAWWEREELDSNNYAKAVTGYVQLSEEEPHKGRKSGLLFVIVYTLTTALRDFKEDSTPEVARTYIRNAYDTYLARCTKISNMTKVIGTNALKEEMCRSSTIQGVRFYIGYSKQKGTELLNYIIPKKPTKPTVPLYMYSRHVYFTSLDEDRDEECPTERALIKWAEDQGDIKDKLENVPHRLGKTNPEGTVYVLVYKLKEIPEMVKKLAEWITPSHISSILPDEEEDSMEVKVIKKDGINPKDQLLMFLQARLADTIKKIKDDYSMCNLMIQFESELSTAEQR